MLANLFRYPGHVADFNKYCCHLPEEWCPMVTIIGYIQSYNDGSLGISEPHCFIIETLAYNMSTSPAGHFSVACFLENTKCWQKVKIPLLGSLLSLTVKIAGQIIDINQLTLRVLNLAYLPKPVSAPDILSSTSSTPLKRSGCWDGWAPSTPLKRPRISEPTHKFGSSSITKIILLETVDSIFNLMGPDNSAEALSITASLSISTDPRGTRLTSVSSLTSDTGTRPY